MSGRIFSYIVAHDYGFAPNPFHGYCTLATCKPKIRSAAKLGDIVLGTGPASKSLAGRLVFAMEVTEILGFDEYWTDNRFSAKVPSFVAALKHVYGDNIYHRADDDNWIQEDSRHSLKHGVPNPGHVSVDTAADRVLISDKFVYFGGEGPVIPDELCAGDSGIVHDRQGHRSRFSEKTVEATFLWLHTLGEGVLGRPADWP